jgi:putative ABC transport system permease protein
MNMRHTLESTFMSLATHAFRSILAALGVVLGVGAVVGMLAISEGARKEAMERIQAQGVDNVVVFSEEQINGESAGDSRGKRYQKYGITTDDVNHFALFDNIQKVVPIVNMNRRIYANGAITDVQLFATTPEFLDITRSRQADRRGRWITDLDEQECQMICVVGSDAARTLFGIDDPLGKELSVYGATFRIVGIAHNERQAELAGKYAINNQVYIPFETSRALYTRELARVDADFVYLRVADVDQIEHTAARLRTYLGTTHEKMDYQISVPFELLQQEKATQRIFTVVMASIAAISLLVGGIGIMNIMLANIYERTKEIGTLRALGAKKQHILIQFLFESVALTGCGGTIGIFVGIGIAGSVQRFAEMQTDVTLRSVVISFVVSVMTGVIFGTYPAWKAANLSPIEALRR